MAFALYMALIMYGQCVLRAVLEEKTSRVVELLVSSIKPFQLMAGKIVGVGGVGLTQYLIWAAAAGVTAAQRLEDRRGCRVLRRGGAGP